MRRRRQWDCGSSCRRMVSVYNPCMLKSRLVWCLADVCDAHMAAALHGRHVSMLLFLNTWILLEQTA